MWKFVLVILISTNGIVLLLNKSDELYSASEKGEVEAVRSLITAGADVNVETVRHLVFFHGILDQYLSQSEGSALMNGACYGSTEVVLLLLKAGARINFQNEVSKIMYIR